MAVPLRSHCILSAAFGVPGATLWGHLMLAVSTVSSWLTFGVPLIVVGAPVSVMSPVWMTTAVGVTVLVS